MTSAISKRQQARNERILQDTLKSVPGNDRCADCGAKNPGWASWNLGVFLCMRCGGLHRKLGTHVSKVKSLSMDSWSSEQVDNMKKVGNIEGNKRWNPKSVRPDIPIDADEVEGAMERFIRQKYEKRAFTPGGGGPAPVPAARQNTGSTGTGSWNDEPPPLPPKPSKKFGFSLRSASSVLPRGKHDRNFTPPLSPAFSGSDRGMPNDPPSPGEYKSSNKPSQMFGMKITSVGNNFDAKLASLRDMGFSDNRRNSDILKSANGNLDTAIEALVRLGEASKPAPRTLTPVSMGSQGMNGISIEKTRQPEKKASSNPWEIREETPQRAATQPLPEPPRSQSVQPTSSAWNPFLSQPQQPQAQQELANSFQNLQMSQTGPTPQQYTQQQAFGGQSQANPWQQASNPWDAVPQVPQIPQQYASDPSATQQYQQPQQYPQQQSPAPLVPQQTSNPFLRRTASQTFAPSNPWGQPAAQQQQQAAPQQQTNNPFGMPIPQQQQQSIFQQPTTQSPAPMFGQQEYFMQQQQPQAQYAQQAPQPDWQQQPQQGQQQAMNPYAQQMMPQATGFPQQQPPQMYQQPPPPPQEQPWQYHEVSTQPQQQARLDKSSILGLYGLPQMAPQRPLQPVMEDSGQQQQQIAQQQFQQQQPQQQQRSVTMPLQQNMNPFGTLPAQPMPQQQGSRHVSNESAAFVGFAGDGRHSPDAFSGLSARYMR